GAALAGDRPSPRTGIRGPLAGLQPPELPGCLLPGHPAATAAQLRRTIDALRARAGDPDALGRRIPDPARGDGGLRSEGDDETPPRRGYRHALPRRHSQSRRRARAAQVGDRGPGRARGRARRARRPGRDLRDLATFAALPGPASDPYPLRPADLPRG